MEVRTEVIQDEANPPVCKVPDGDVLVAVVSRLGHLRRVIDPQHRQARVQADKPAQSFNQTNQSIFILEL